MKKAMAAALAACTTAVALAGTVTPGHSFTYGGVAYRGVPDGWPRETKEVVSDGGARTVSTTVAREPGTGLEMSVVTTRYRDLPVVEWTLAFENKGTAATKRFTRIAPGDFALAAAPADQVALWRGIGESTQRPLPQDAVGNYSYRRLPLRVGSVEKMGSSGGFPNWRAFPYFRLYGPKGGHTVAIGWQGQWTAEVARVASAVKVEARQETVDFDLKPGEKAISPTVTVMRFADDDDAVNGWRRFMRRWILPRAKDGVRPIRPILGLDGDWCGGILYGKMRERRHLEQIRQLHEKGLRFDIWWIDAGWYQRRAGKDEKGVDHTWYSEVGDWTCDPGRFESGSFAKISEALAACGAMLTLWHEPERVSEMCGPFFERAKPYLVAGGNEKCRRYDLTCDDAVEFLSRAVGGSIRDNRVGFYREDCNQTVSDGWKDLERQRADGRRGLVENQFVQGRFKFWENLRKVNPNLYFDICAGGGRRNDLSTLRFPSVPLHYTDIGYTNYVMKCRAHHMCHEWLFFRKNLDSFYHTRIVDGRRMIDRRKAVIDLAEQHMVHAAAVLGDKRQEAEEMELIAAWRKVSDYLVDGDYYLLTPEVFGDDRWWVTEFRNPSGDDGFMQVVRNPKSPDGTCRVTLRGVTPGRKLLCTDLFSGRTFTVTGGKPFDLALPPDAGTLVTFKPLQLERSPVAAASFSFVYRGVAHRGIPDGWLRTVERRDDADGDRTYVTTRATEPGTGLELVLVETRYRDLPVCEWEVTFANGGTADSGRLTRLSSLDWDVPLAAENRRLWHGVGETDNQHADRNYWFETLAVTNGMDFAWRAREGYPSYYTFPYFRLSDRTGGYTVALGYQGQWAGNLTCRDGRVNVRAGQETVDFYLKPGETAISPKVTVLKFADDDDAVNGWRRFMRRYVLPRGKDGRRPLRPILAGGHHEGGCLFVQTTEKGQVDAIRSLAAAGIFCDTWWIDAGWYTRTSKCSAELMKDPLVWYRTAGDWTSDPERLPNGFRPIADELAAHGGSLTLWFEPERLYETNPFMAKVRPYLTPKPFGGSCRYDLSRPDVVAFLGKYIGDQLDFNDVGIFRQDSNGSGPLVYWQSQEAKLADGRRGFVENLAVRGEFALWAEWRRRRPHMLFDTCASGGRRNDLSTLRFPSVPLHYSDTSYGDPIAKQRHYHMMNEWLFYHKNSSGHFRPGGRFSRRIAVSQLAQFFHIRDSHFLTGESAPFFEYLALWRRLAPLTVDGDYYLLTPAVFGDDRWWVTEFFEPKRGVGFLQVVRNPKSPDETCEVTLKGLRPGERVTCEDLYSHRTFEAVGGQALKLALPPDDGTFIAFRR